jgi:hypothetical protein
MDMLSSTLRKELQFRECEDRVLRERKQEEDEEDCIRKSFTIRILHQILNF